MLFLNDPVTNIKGIGPKKAKVLDKLEIKTVEDLLYYFPRAYEDRRNKVKISDLREGQPSVIQGEIISKENPGKYNRGKAPFKLYIKDDTGILEIVFFKATYLDSIFKTGKDFIFYGTPTRNFNKLQIIHPDFRPSDEGPGPEILPIYPLTENLGQKEIRKWESELIDLMDSMKEYLPEDTIKRNNLCGISYALKNIHFPETKKKYSEARYRLVFEELLMFQLGLTSIKRKNTEIVKGISFTNIDINPFIDNLKFSLTGAQSRVIGEIYKDMEAHKPMNRLVQGDVGSGKTVVAAASIYKAVKSGYQAVMMAPTEILAAQHYEEIKTLFENLNIRMALLTGSVKKTRREKILCKLAAGEIDIILGTHALIQDDVKYKKLGLAITDEQHRFGVKQRISLSEKGHNADVLVMTATPIPRTLAFILYGDLDISVIDEMPPGRQKIITKYANGKERKGVYSFVRKQVEQGRQAYVVAPLIEDSHVLEQIKSAESLYKELQSIFKGFSIALLHGSMKQQEKDEIMEDFYSGNVHVLVSTVVIEVGINVKNATVIVVENAERFGLAQLHQLRGRVGRGEHQSYCILISDSKTEVAKERLKLMTETDDGFEISEKDLEMRGPGDMFGMRQHGLPQMRLSDLVKHADMLGIIKDETKIILNNDPDLKAPENRMFKNKIEKMFKSVSKIGL